MLRKKIKSLFGGKPNKSAEIISRHKHHLSRKQISQNALKVLYRLNKAGYSAFLVGGGVRDLLLRRKPKDFDVATNGYPEELRKLFVNSRIIGRRFRLLHVFFPKEIIEVSTFRANAQEDDDEVNDEAASVMIAADNTYGTIEEDAWRRDFTVNALYYNIDDFSVVDFTGGMSDLKKKIIRMIGDPVQRYHEDPVRLLRAIRLAAKLNFTIHPDTEEPLGKLAGLLQHVPESRLFDELLKLFFEGNAKASFEYLERYDYLRVLFCSWLIDIEPKRQKFYRRFMELALRASDERFADGRSLNPGFLLSILLWPAVEKAIEDKKNDVPHLYQALHAAIDDVIELQNDVLRIPRRFTAMMRTIWVMQFQLMRRRGKRVFRTLRHRYFRAGFDFLVLRAEAGDPCKKEAKWWDDFQNANHDEKRNMVYALTRQKKKH